MYEYWNDVTKVVRSKLLEGHDLLERCIDAGANEYVVVGGKNNPQKIMRFNRQ